MNNLRTSSVSEKQREVKRIIDTDNRARKKEESLYDATDKLRKELSTSAGRKRLKNKRMTEKSKLKMSERRHLNPSI